MAQADNEALRAENQELSQQVSTLKESGKAMKAKNAEQWACKKAMENERDKAILELSNLKEHLEAVEIRAESQVGMR